MVRNKSKYKAQAHLMLKLWNYLFAFSDLEKSHLQGTYSKRLQ